MFRQSDTNNIEWFSTKQEIITSYDTKVIFRHIPVVDEEQRVTLNLQYDIKSLLKYRSEIGEETGALKSRLNESEEEKKSEIE